MLGFLTRCIIGVLLLGSVAHAGSSSTEASREKVVTGTATVQSVNQETRELVIRAQDGTEVRL